MLSAIFSAIPIIGSIVQGITQGWFNKEVAFRQADVSEAQVSAQIIQTNARNVFLNVCVDIIVFPVAVWTALVTWDTIVALHYPHAMWHVAGFDKTSLPYLPYAVLTFLLGNIGINMWSRK